MRRRFPTALLRAPFLLVIALALPALGALSGCGGDETANNNKRRNPGHYVVEVPEVNLRDVRQDLRAMANTRSPNAPEARVGALLGLAELRMQDDESMSCARDAIRQPDTPAHRRVGAASIGIVEAGFRVYAAAGGKGAAELVKYIDDSSTTLERKVMAANTLATIGAPAQAASHDVMLLAELSTTPHELRLALLNALGSIGHAPDGVFDRILKMVEDGDEDISVAALLVFSGSTALAGGAIDKVRELVPHLHGSRAIAATHVLAREGSEKSLRLLVDCMQRTRNEDARLPRAAADALLSSNMKAAAWGALDTLATSTDPTCRTAAWYTLSRVDPMTDDVNKAVAEGLASASSADREGAAPIALSHGIGTMDHWMGCLEVDSVSLQRTAARALIAQNGKRAVPGLLKLVESSNEVNIRGGLMALMHLGKEGRPALETVVSILDNSRRDPKLRSLAVDLLGVMQPEVPEPAVPRLLRRLRDVDEVEEARIITTLGKLPLTTESRDEIIRRFQRSPAELDDVVRRAAVDAVANRFDDRGPRLLEAWREGRLIATDLVAHVADEDAAFRQALLERIGEDGVALGVVARMKEIPAEAVSMVMHNLPAKSRNDEVLAVLRNLSDEARAEHAKTIIELAVERPETVDDRGWVSLLGSIEKKALGAAMSATLARAETQTVEPEPETLAALEFALRLGPTAREAAQTLYSITLREGASFDLRDPSIKDDREFYLFPYQALAAWALGATMSEDTVELDPHGTGGSGAGAGTGSGESDGAGESGNGG